jgi:ATP-dependent exoDNAse (exonuclease V) alpha subunit
LAIYHHSIKIISRGKGKSAVAAAAYRAGETLTNEYDGITHDYTRKGGIVHAEILLPENAPSEYKDRATLWNAVEKAERYKTAQLAREIEIALPVELTQEQSLELVRAYVKENFVKAGMCADICIHDKSDGNPHAHIMLTLRPIDERGEWAAKSKSEYMTDKNGERIRQKNGNFKSRKIPTTDWNEQTKVEEWRAAWAQSVNVALGKNGIVERVDHRSYARQGIEQIPTVHLGVAASQMERKGIRTERGNRNRIIEVSNKELRQTKARLDKLKKWIADETKHEAAAPTLADVLDGILQGGEQKGRYARIHDLKAAADTLSFMQEHRISTIAELRGVVTEYYGRLSDIRGKSKPIERKMKTLDEHIRQAETLSKHRKVYEQYAQQKPKKREAFYESHRAEITLYESASRYMKEHLNGRSRIPMKEWRAERSKLATKSRALSVELHSLKVEIKKVEVIRRHAEGIQRTITPPQKPRGKELDI